MSAPAAGDAGLFGPGSVTWRVHGDPIMWVAGLRALLLQAVHPAAMAGVLRHSDFRADPWGRLLRTADYVGVVSFGSTAQVDAVGARVRAIHRKVRGVDPDSGIGYRADDPELLRWVHCCEVESFLSTYQRAGGGLSATEVDAYYAEQTRAAAVVGLDPAIVPATAEQMVSYFARMRPSLAVDDRTRKVAGYVFLPPMPRRVELLTPARPVWAGVAGLAAALLPGWARRLYGLPGWRVTDVSATASLRALRAATAAAPPGYREGPHLRAARQRLAQAAVDAAAAAAADGSVVGDEPHRPRSGGLSRRRRSG
ncbi:MAG TPA: oxygenase MpaB family protein [Mycobacteriales bacterium]|nr:oxygenase MpaB family protein [Mycobacteriales bacterium]